MLPILNESFWRDEAFSALLSQHSPLDIIRLTAKDQSPPLHSFLLHYWMLLFGTTETAIRSLSLLFHLATVGVVFLFMKRISKSFPAALFTAIAVLLNPFLLQYAFEARGYSLLAFLTISAIYAVFEKKYWIAGIFLSLALFTHNFALFTLLSLGIWWIYKEKQQLFKNFRQALSLFLLPIISLLGWGIVVWNQWVRVGHGFWIQPVTSAILLQTFESFSRGDLDFPSRHFLVIVSYILVFFAASFWMWKKENNEQQQNIGSLLLFVSVGPIAIAYIISVLFAPIFFDRYLIATVPTLILLVAYSLLRFWQENPTKKTLLTVFLSCFFLLLVFASEHILNSLQKPSINWAVTQIVSQTQPGDVIIPKDDLNYLETKWYVEQSGKNIQVLAYAPSGKIPFYIGSILYSPQDIIKSLPTDKRYWQVNPDGGYQLVTPVIKKK